CSLCFNRPLAIFEGELIRPARVFVVRKVQRRTQGLLCLTVEASASSGRLKLCRQIKLKQQVEQPRGDAVGRKRYNVCARCCSSPACRSRSRVRSGYRSGTAHARVPRTVRAITLSRKSTIRRSSPTPSVGRTHTSAACPFQ